MAIIGPFAGERLKYVLLNKRKSNMSASGLANVIKFLTVHSP